ncbi:MAG: Daunorubicin/doxorubicin resistance ATP-binding protein DrrA [Alphaproteobacteria bacterium MarineAlpha5_Bin9]|nr:MAG: Daunorubicin/doxorubicin resistance ATP-binding protein DrrA [Alphaproteobacteria bacterium MarineAlpha5_Bin9]|tara:strand:- start:30175 stop:31104 length:930 start_codon:yes stop_codon:yes gene_type:complete
MKYYKYAIQAKDLNKTFNKKNFGMVHALTNFNIKIPKGSIYGLLGPNGAGKSTFINILGGLVKKDSGKVSICEIDTEINPKESRRKIGIVPQELNMDPFFTPLELLELQAGMYGVKNKDRKTNEILEKVGLLEQKNSYARNLSGGMRRRLLVAKALVHQPDVLILDEPTAGVDFEIRQNIWEYVSELKNNGTTICLTTHYLEEAEKLCDNIIIINKGKILKDDTKKNILNLIGKKTARFILESSKINIPDILSVYNPTLNNNILTLNYDKNINNIREIIEILNQHSIKFNEINTYESDLEDVFVELISK